MLSNKLTFSLALVLMLALVAGPVFAQQLHLGDTAIDDKGFLVFEMPTAAGGGAGTPGQNGATADHGPNGIIRAGLSIVTPNTGWADLSSLFAFGGTIELWEIIKAPETGLTAAPTITDAHKKTAADRLKRLVISEIMWGVDASAPRPATPAVMPEGLQWVEVYNGTGAARGAATNTLGALYLYFRSNDYLDRAGTAMVMDPTAAGSTATFEDDYIVAVVDSVSTTNRFGQRWTLKGNSGRVIANNDVNPPLPSSNLVSMYRKGAIKDAGYEIKDNVIKDLGRGDAAGSWEASAARDHMGGPFIGTPGAIHRPNIGGGGKYDEADVIAAKDGMGIIINEIRDDTSEANIDWVELHNRNADGTDPITVDGRHLRLVTATLNDDGTHTGHSNSTILAKLPNYKIPPGGYLLIVNRDPSDPGSPLAGGINLSEIIGKNEVNRGAKHVYFVSEDLNLPGEGKYLLTLRSGDKTNTHEQFIDFAGNGFFKKGSETDIWPLRGWSVPGDLGNDTDKDGFNRATIASATMSIGRVGALTDQGVYRSKSGANRLHHDHWKLFGNQGSIGYDRDVDPMTSPGTPGYGNEGGVNLISDDRKNTSGTDDYAFGGTVTISEVMYDAGPNWNLVQWIELYNSSLTEPVDLAGWKVEIHNKEDVQSYVDASFTFVEDDAQSTVILPNQAKLLVSRSGASDDVLQQRVYDLYKNHRDELGLPTGRVARLLSRTGFNIKLYAKLEDREGNVTRRESMMLVDEAGNLMVSIDDESREVMWELPERDPAARRSIVRQYGTRERDNSGHDPANDGTMADSWNQSILAGAGLSYYGHRNDIGTPGYRLGGPLPVSLSSFRPVRDDATGHVVVRWITQSELNNAGFNILRSETRNGEFKVVNVKGIVPGHGTTSEKHVYEWTDTSAKPNVIYYYQIEDVSLNGERTTLTTTRLKGHVSAAGKLTTTWSRLKQRD